VHLPQLDLKLAHGTYDEGGEQRGVVGVVETVEGASEAIVSEEAGLLWLETKVLWDASGGPLGESVDGAACEQEVGDEDAEGDGSGDAFGAPGGWGQVTRQERPQLQTVEEVADDGRGTNFEGLKGGVIEGGGHR
jgi:hypothetical protein